MMIVLNSPAVADDNGRAIIRATKVSLVEFIVFMPQTVCKALVRIIVLANQLVTHPISR